MYYEEKCEHGVWYFRGTPDGEWREFSKQMLQEKIFDLTKDGKRLRDEVAELRALLEECQADYERVAEASTGERREIMQGKVRVTRAALLKQWEARQ